MNPTVGIDLGTTNSAAVVLKDGKMRTVPSDEGPTPNGKMLASVVAFKTDGEILIGRRAQEYSHSHPERAVRWIKREMGTSHKIRIDDACYTPTDISAIILAKMKEDAEKFLDEEVKRAVITAPAYFSNSQRAATKRAGELAGFEVLRVLSEPTAAALAYGLGLHEQDLKVAVLDLGAGTLDVTLLEMNNGIFNVLATCGDTHLGGKDMDDRILEYAVSEIEAKFSFSPRRDPRAMSVLRDAVEEAKIELSQREKALINPHLRIEDVTIEPALSLTRERLEQLVLEVLERIDEPILRALDDSRLSFHDIDRVVLVGGPTKMPIVWKRVQSIFSKAPETGLDPMGVVAMGALIQASMLSGEIKDKLLLDVTPLSLGIETSGGVFTRLITRNTTIPARVSRVFATKDDGQTSMLIHVLQGEREMVHGNASLGIFRVEGIPASPRYEQEVEVTFDVDENGILGVTAEVLETGRRVSVTVSALKDLDEDDLARMIIEATKFDKIDSKRSREAQAKQKAEAIIFGARNAIKRASKRLDDAQIGICIEAVDRLELLTMEGDAIKLARGSSEVVELVKRLNQTLRYGHGSRTLISSVLEKSGDRKDESSPIKAQLGGLESSSGGNLEEEMRKLRELLLLLETDEAGV